MLDFFVSVREILDITEEEWDIFETTSVDVADLQAKTQAEGERSRGAFAGERGGYRWSEGGDSRLLELPSMDLKGVILKCGRSMV